MIDASTVLFDVVKGFAASRLSFEGLNGMPARFFVINDLRFLTICEHAVRDCISESRTFSLSPPGPSNGIATMLTVKKPLLLKLAAGAVSMVALLQSGLGQDAVPDRIYAEKVREQNITTTQGYTPLGNRSDANRFGEDGSAALVDIAGLVMWKTSNGVVRTIPNSTKARPLFVTDHECLVWMNAFEPSASLRLPLRVGYFRLDSQTGNLQTKFITLDGTTIVETPQITDPTMPFGLVTVYQRHPTEVLLVDPQLNYNSTSWYYRLTWDGEAQLLSTNTREDRTYQYFEPDLGINVQRAVYGYGGAWINGYDLIGSGNDGSYVIRYLNERGFLAEIVWVDSEGRYQVFSDRERYDDQIAYRGVRVTNTSVILAPAYPAVGPHEHYTRTSDSKEPPVEGFITRPAQRSTLPFLYWGPLGKATYIYEATFNTATPPGVTSIVQSRLVEGAYVEEATFTIPQSVVAVDPTYAAVVAINSSEGNLVDQDEVLPATAVIRGLRTVSPGGGVPRSCYLWLHQGIPGFNFDPSPFPALSTSSNAISNELTAQQGNAAIFPASGGNFSFVGHSVTANPTGYPLLVSRNQLVYSENSFSSNTDSGARPPVHLRHYNNTVGGITARYGNETYTGIRRAPIVNLLPFTSESAEPSPIPGNHVVIPAAHNTEPRNWRFATYLKRATNNSFDIFEFKLADSKIADIDSDGIVSALEDSPYYIIPGNFTYAQAVADATLHGGVLADLNTAPAELAVAQRAVRYQLDREASRFGTRIHLPSTGLWLAAVSQPPAPPIATHLTPELEVRTIGSLSQVRGGYLLKMPSTDRYEPDADGDHLVDGAELHKTITSPAVANFSEVPQVPTYDPAKDGLGNYAGVIHGALGQELAIVELAVAKAGKFTGRLLGPLGAVSFRGSLDEDKGSASIRLTYGASTVDGALQLISSGSTWIVEGNFLGLSAVQGTPSYWPRQSRPASFKLVRKVSSTPKSGTYTVVLPSTGFIGTPAGDGYATFKLASSGSVQLAGRLANNVSVTWKGNLLEDGRLAVGAFSSKSAKASAVGNLFLRSNAKFNLLTPTREESDVDGTIAAATVGDSNFAGYDVFTAAYGSFQSPVGFAQLPAFTEYAMSSNNVRLDFQAGSIPSRAFIATWDSKGKISAPTTQTLSSLNFKYDNRTGVVSGGLNYNDPERNYSNTYAKAYGVMLQKSGEIRGFYSTGVLHGKFEVTPNDAGNPAPITQVVPSARGLSANGGEFDVNVTSSEPWSVAVPPSAMTWLVVDTLSGYGDGKVRVSVSPNFSSTSRSAVIKIAGKSLFVSQLENATISTVVLTSTYQAMIGTGGNYPVYLSATGGFSADLVNGQSFNNGGFDWVTVTPNVVGGVVTSATVTVARNAEGFVRTADVIIGGRVHRVVQGPI